MYGWIIGWLSEWMNQVVKWGEGVSDRGLPEDVDRSAVLSDVDVLYGVYGWKVARR